MQKEPPQSFFAWSVSSFDDDDDDDIMMVMAMVILKMGSSYTIAILSICVVLDSSVAPSRGAEAPGGFGGRLRVRARPLLAWAGRTRSAALPSAG